MLKKEDIAAIPMHVTLVVADVEKLPKRGEIVLDVDFDPSWLKQKMVVRKPKRITEGELCSGAKALSGI